MGRLVARLIELNEFENTVIVLASDNGGTAEGGPTGTRSYFAQFGIGTSLPENWLSDVPRDPQDLGGPQVFGQYPTGWARVSNTPFRSFKSTTYEGGVHAPLLVSWPAAPGGAPGIRDQFVFVSDLAPTLLELVGVPPLGERGGVRAQEIDGRSIADLLSAPGGVGREEQYFECVGRRALVVGEWKIVSSDAPTPDAGAAGGNWELYHLVDDPTETVDRAAEYPDLVARLAEQWREQAWANTVFPLDDGELHTVRPATEAALAAPVTLVPYRPPLERYRSAQLTVLKSFDVDISLTLTGTSQGVVVAHGDQGGGYLFAIEDGVPVLSYNAYGVMHRVRGLALGTGSLTLRLSFAEVEEMRWRISLHRDEQLVAELPSMPMLLGMAPFTGISVGYDYGGPVDWDLHERQGSFRFSGGTIDRLRYVPGARSDHDPVVLREIERAVARLVD